MSGSGKSSLVSQALVELVSEHLGHEPAVEESSDDMPLPDAITRTAGRLGAGVGAIRRLVNVDQKPIGRTPRSNLATYTGLFGHVRKLFAATRAAKARRYGVGTVVATTRERVDVRFPDGAIRRFVPRYLRREA